MTNSTFKILAFFCLIFLAYNTKAQTWYKAFNDPTASVFIVDEDTPDGASPDGTIGSWYKWEITGPTGYSASYKKNDNNPDTSNVEDGNEVKITWNRTVGDYIIKATEYNSCDATTGDVVDKMEEVSVVKPDVTNLEPIYSDPANPNICAGTPIDVKIIGTAGATVKYQIIGGLGNPEGEVIIPASGEIPVAITPNTGVNKVTLNVTNVIKEYTGANTITVDNNNLIIGDITKYTVDINVSAPPVITPIKVMI